MNWAVGVTSTQSRINTLLPKTVDALKRGGFSAPHIFFDGVGVYDLLTDGALNPQNVRMTMRAQQIRVFANWFLALGELYFRNPHADRYAIFQDDLVCYVNLRSYLEACELPALGYWNCYTFRCNEYIVENNYVGWYESALAHHDHHDPAMRTMQTGRGALALVFNREGVLALLSSRSMYERAQNEEFGWRSVDGAVVNTLNLAGFREYIHNPSLVDHTGVQSSMSSKIWSRRALTWRGEQFDAVNLIAENPTLRKLL